eukprot:3450521-Pyramimonas_sp.AAC.1
MIQQAAQRLMLETEDRQARFARGLLPHFGQAFGGGGRPSDRDFVGRDNACEVLVESGTVLWTEA